MNWTLVGQLILGFLVVVAGLSIAGSYGLYDFLQKRTRKSVLFMVGGFVVALAGLIFLWWTMFV